MNLDRVHEYLLETSRTATRTADECGEQILGATAAIVESLRGGGKLLLCGNGGSAGDAQHLATEFVSTLTTDRRRDAIAAIALTTDTSLLTAVANDFGFDGVFERQVEALGREGDVLVGISTSGNSENVLRAFAKARSASCSPSSRIFMSASGLGPLADIEINVPSTETSHIQEAHIAVGQLIAFLVEDELFPR